MEQEQRIPFEKDGLSTQEERTTQVQRAVGVNQIFRCANCDIEFFWLPTVVQDRVYCCTGCAAGGPCNCDYSLYRPLSILSTAPDE